VERLEREIALKVEAERKKKEEILKKKKEKEKKKRVRINYVHFVKAGRCKFWFKPKY